MDLYPAPGVTVYRAVADVPAHMSADEAIACGLLERVAVRHPAELALERIESAARAGDRIAGGEGRGFVATSVLYPLIEESRTR